MSIWKLVNLMSSKTCFSRFVCFLGKEFESKYKMALQLLSSQHFSLQNHETEFAIVQNIHKLLANKERYQDVRKFDELHSKLKKLSVCIF
jgi:hypothetical protein